MTISIFRYVDINSAVLGTPIVGTRQLILNMFTVNPLVPPQSYITFNTPDEVGSYFGTSSEEYLRAVQYFGFVSKSNNSPTLIQFTRWVKAGVAGFVLGYQGDTSVSDWQSIGNGAIGLTIGGTTQNITGLNFATATTLGSPLVLSATLSTSSTTATMTNTAGLANGMPVFGTGIPNGTTVVSFIADTSMVLSNTPTVAGAQSLTFGASVAAILQIAINEANAVADWTGATVVYSPTQSNFILTGGVVGSEVIAVQPGTGGTDISGAVVVTGQGQLGWYPQSQLVGGVYIPGATWAQGSVAESIPTTLGNAASANNNFGSIAFCYTGVPGSVTLNGTTVSSSEAVSGISSTAALAVGMIVTGAGIPTSPATTISAIGSNGTSITLSQNATASATVALTFTDVNTGLSLAQYTQAASWNASLIPNNLFKLDVPVLTANASAYASALSGYAGTCLTLTDYIAPVSSLSTQFPEICDATVMAATDYSPGAVNSVQNYMFQNFPALRPLVSSDSVATAYDALRINYIGVTQNAGQQISFYQRGFLQGGITAARDSGVYANEQWLKSAITTQVMNLLLSQNYVPANTQGLSQLYAIMQAPIQQAITNGTISVGKILTAQQISNIGQVTGNNLAWQQVQNSGFYLVITIGPNPNIPGEYQANYILVYSKNDTIRFVKGTDNLI